MGTSPSQLRNESRERTAAMQRDVKRLGQLTKSNEVYAQWDDLPANAKRGLEENVLSTDPNTIAALRDFLPTDLAKEVASYTHSDFYTAFLHKHAKEPEGNQSMIAKFSDGRRLWITPSWQSAMVMNNAIHIGGTWQQYNQLANILGWPSRKNPIFCWNFPQVLLSRYGAFYKPNFREIDLVPCDLETVAPENNLELVREYTDALNNEVKTLAPDTKIRVFVTIRRGFIYDFTPNPINECLSEIQMTNLAGFLGNRRILICGFARVELPVRYLILDDGRFARCDFTPEGAVQDFAEDVVSGLVLTVENNLRAKVRDIFLPPKSNNDDSESKSFKSRTERPRRLRYATRLAPKTRKSRFVELSLRTR